MNDNFNPLTKTGHDTQYIEQRVKLLEIFTKEFLLWVVGNGQVDYHGPEQQQRLEKKLGEELVFPHDSVVHLLVLAKAAAEAQTTANQHTCPKCYNTLGKLIHDHSEVLDEGEVCKTHTKGKLCCNMSHYQVVGCCMAPILSDPIHPQAGNVNM